MRSDWQNYLSKRGALIEQGVVQHFGDLGAELAATKQDGVCADLSHTGLLLCSGEDAGSFLHSQFSGDVKALDLNSSHYASYCTAKGRMLATFLLWKMPNGYAMQLPAELLAPIQKRLAMFTLRAKAKGVDIGEQYARFGIAGTQCEALLQKIFGGAPLLPHQVRQLDDGALIRLDGMRFELVLASESAQFYWEKLVAELKPVGTPCWEWLDIRAGIPWITAATQEQFIPQMANLELIGGVNFKKGCYPGQEIVARTQYLGKVKRRMFLANVNAAALPIAGDPLFSTDPAAQESGMIVNAQSAPDGGYDVLAVLQTSSVEAGAVHLKAPDGPPLQFLALPYAA